MVDDNKYDYLRQFNWKITKGYAMRTTGIGERRMHRLLINAKKGEVVDHIDGNPLNNQVANLRICSQGQNMGNRKINKNNRSGYKGVFFLKSLNKWRAAIKFNGKFIHIGLFAKPEDAAIAYNRKAIEFFGIFANLNTKEVKK